MGIARVFVFEAAAGVVMAMSSKSAATAGEAVMAEASAAAAAGGVAHLFMSRSNFERLADGSKNDEYRARGHR